MTSVFFFFFFVVFALCKIVTKTFDLCTCTCLHTQQFSSHLSPLLQSQLTDGRETRSSRQRLAVFIDCQTPITSNGILYALLEMSGWMTCNFTSDISEQWGADNDRLCAMKSRLWLESFSVSSGSRTRGRQINRLTIKVVIITHLGLTEI